MTEAHAVHDADGGRTIRTRTLVCSKELFRYSKAHQIEITPRLSDSAYSAIAASCSTPVSRYEPPALSRPADDAQKNRNTSRRRRRVGSGRRGTRG